MAQLSKVWEAQRALVAGITAQLPGVAVDLGAPVHYEQDHVWVSGQVPEWTLRDGVSGLGAQDEDFILLVHVFVQRAGADYAEVADRAEVMGDAVKTALQSDPYFAPDNATINFARPAGGQVEETTYDGKRECLLTVQVRCQAWVS